MVAWNQLTRDRFIDRASRGGYLWSAMDYMGGSENRSYDIPIPQAPVRRSIGASAAPDPTQITAEQLLVNRNRSSNRLITLDQEAQLLGGGRFGMALADSDYDYIAGHVDDDMFLGMLRAAQFAGLNAADYDGANVRNSALNAVTRAEHSAWHSSLVRPGQPRSSFRAGYSPTAWGLVRELYGASVRTSVENPALGVPFEGLDIDGVPSFEAIGVPDEISFGPAGTYRTATNAAVGSTSAILSNVLTVTFDSPHPFQVGMRVTTTGGSANVTSAVAITAATELTVTIPLTSANNATNGAVTVRCRAAHAVLWVQPHAWWAGDIFPRPRSVADKDTPGAVALQMTTFYGRYVLNGSVRLLQFPLP